MRIFVLILGTFLTVCSLPASADIGDTDTDLMIRMYSPPNTFNLFQQNDHKKLSFSTDKKLKVCDTKSKDSVGLKIKHDGTTSMIKPGGCATYTARNFNISPAGPVGEDYDLIGTIEKAKG
jgi:hypothetical protein